MLRDISVRTDRAAFSDTFVVNVDVAGVAGPFPNEAKTTVADVLRQLAAELTEHAEQLDAPDKAARADAEMIDQIETDRLIFQALCTERDRLAKLPKLGPDRLAASTQLVRVYADRLADLPGTDAGCPCVVLPSGKIYPCQDHAKTAERSGLAVDTSYRVRRNPVVELTPDEWLAAVLAGRVYVTWDAAGMRTSLKNEDDE